MDRNIFNNFNNNINNADGGKYKKFNQVMKTKVTT